jgi:hypothetical protein
MNQLSVKIQTHPLILNSINDRNYFSFQTLFLLRFKISKETKFTNIYSKQFLTNSPFYQIKNQFNFFKTNYKIYYFYILIDCQSSA